MNKITEKGQVTIPQDIRMRYGLLPHTRVIFVERDGKVYIQKISEKSARGQELIRQMKGKSSVKMTTDEILSLTRNLRREK